ncbi:hypothetical protein CCACVL1_04039, partial [Corchorus capsularis]
SANLATTARCPPPATSCRC